MGQTVNGMMTGRGRTVVLRRRLGDLSTLNAINVVLETLSRTRGLRFQSSTLGDETDEVPYLGYVFAAPELRIVLCEDYSSGISYFEIHPREGALTQEALALLAELPRIDASEVRPFVLENFRERPGLLVGLVLAESATQSPETVALVRDAMSDPEQDVRVYAARAAGQSRSKLFLPDLDRLAQSDPSNEVKSAASAARELLLANGE